MSKAYDAKYFIKKFKAIPDDEWTTGSYKSNDQCCSLGHCGLRDSYSMSRYPEASALDNMMRRHFGSSVININDGLSTNNHNEGDDYYTEFGDTPKERILVALEIVKALEG